MHQQVLVLAMSGTRVYESGLQSNFETDLGPCPSENLILYKIPEARRIAQ